MTATWERSAVPTEGPEASVASEGADEPEAPAPAATEETSGTPGATAERARDGLEHLQAAARELIAAARAALDVAEDIVDDPSVVRDLTESRPSRPSGAASWLEGITSMAGAFGTLTELIRNATSARPTGSDSGSGSGTGPDASSNGHGPSAGDTAVERIIIR